MKVIPEITPVRVRILMEDSISHLISVFIVSIIRPMFFRPKTIFTLISIEIDSLRHPPVLINFNVKLNNTILIGENITFDCRYKSSVLANFSWFRVFSNETYQKLNVNLSNLFVYSVCSYFSPIYSLSSSAFLISILS